MKKIEHIGIAVNDIAEAGNIYQKLLNTWVYKTEDVEAEGVKTAFLQCGPNKIELLQALNADSPVAKFIDKRGEGVHHIAFEVDDIVAEMARLKREGFVLLSDKPKLGADNKLVCFVHPKGVNGVLVELVQDKGKYPSKSKTKELDIDEQMNLFEFRNKLNIPDDLKAYFIMNNSEIDAYNEDMFTFYKFDEFKSVKEEVGEYGGVPDYKGIVKTLPQYENCFVFCEYFTHLTIYAIRLHNPPSVINEVYVICGDAYKLVANSFREFIDIYKNDWSDILF